MRSIVGVTLEPYNTVEGNELEIGLRCELMWKECNYEWGSDTEE